MRRFAVRFDDDADDVSESQQPDGRFLKSQTAVRPLTLYAALNFWEIVATLSEFYTRPTRVGVSMLLLEMDAETRPGWSRHAP